MKRIITVIFLLLAVIILYSQSVDNVFRLRGNDNITKYLMEFDTQIFFKIKTLEVQLDYYKEGRETHTIEKSRNTIQEIREKLSVNKPQSLSRQKWEILQNGLCLDCYEKELNYYAAQQEIKAEQKRITRQKSDSVRKAQNDSLALVQRISDSINFSKPAFAIDTSYSGRMTRLMTPFGRNKRDMTFTTFCGVRVNFAMNKLGWYLQENMGMTDKDFKVNGDKLSITYVPRVSSSTQKEHITVTYTLAKNKYSNDDDKKVITRCNITGTSELILKLFIHYWANMVKIDETKTGEVAYYNYIADRVSLVSDGRTYKIEIKQIGDGFDYETVGK